MVRRWFWNILIAIDQLFNAILLGDPDETLSSRMGKRQSTCKLCYFLCRLLHLIDKNHCEKSIERDEGKREIM